ncbi:MAG TPA: dicarboxylate/amino acid:cation symporter, partial [Steroidobacteraceae bacterium]|nr:dicarboxylate/amino acid:cation symporter [Steroidobacteraceae bacterium]
MANPGATASRPTPVAPILIAMALGAFVGWLCGPHGLIGDHIGSVDVVRVFEFIGALFINLLKMLIVPLIASSIIVGVATLGSSRDLGRLGAKTLAFYVVTTLLAVLIALTVINVVKPGIVDGEPARHLLALEADAGSVTNTVKERASASVFDTLLNIVPPNIVEAAAATKLLGLVFFSLLFGYFLARIELPYRQTVTDFWQGVFRVMMLMTEFVMRLAPIGVFGLTARVVAKAGFDAAGPILVFGACVLVALAVHMFVALPALIRIVGRVSPWPLFPAMSPALLTAFSTASSSATLPLSLECVEKRAHVSERITSFVMPLGASINHAGSALYECAAAMFICQAYGLELSFGTQFTVVILALITSMG